MSDEAREILELMQITMAGIDSQFQFWLTITFGIVVASFLAKEELTRLVRSVLAFLYILCVALIVVKSMAYVETLVFLQARFLEIPGTQPNVYVPYVGGIRVVATSLGTVAATVFVLVPRLARRPSSSPADSAA